MCCCFSVSMQTQSLLLWPVRTRGSCLCFFSPSPLVTGLYLLRRTVCLRIHTSTLSRLHSIKLRHISRKVAAQQWEGRTMPAGLDGAWCVCRCWFDTSLPILQCLNESLPISASLLTLTVSGWRCSDWEQVESFYEYSYRRKGRQTTPNLRYLFLSVYFVLFFLDFATECFSLSHPLSCVVEGCMAKSHQYE